MDFELTADQKLLVDTVASFAKRESPPSRLRKLREDAIGYSRDTWKQMAELGWLGVMFPESMGGYGGGFLDVALILEQLGTTLVPEPIIPSLVLVGTALRDSGDSKAIERWLPPLIAGEVTYAFAYAEEGARYNPLYCNTRAEKRDGGWLLRGKKAFVLNGHAADEILVVARTSGEVDSREGLALFMVPKGAVNLGIKPIRLIDGHRAAVLSFEGVEVSDAQKLEVADVASLIELVIDHGAAAACAEGVGVMRASLDLTADYLRTRTQFGVKIGSFQALQHRAVDMFVEVELSKSTSIYAAIKVSDPDPIERASAISASKAQLGVSGRYVTQQAIQLHGGIGITDEHDIGLYFKRMQSLNTLFGDEEHHVQRFASSPTFAG
ncbi:MAG: acyl-CoA dehydrogenase [Polyangiaceae bacterium]